MRRSTLVALAVFGALLAAVLATLGERPERGITRISFAAVEPDQVTRIEIEGKTKATLSREGDGWKLDDGKRADAIAIDRLLQAVGRIHSADVVTRDAERFADLGVDDAGGTTLRLLADDRELARFTVGKPARGGMNLRVGDAVYLVRGVFPSVFTRERSQWIEKKLFQVKREDVKEVKVARADGTEFSLVEKDGVWQLADPSILPAGFRFDHDQARALANQVINARARDVLDEDPGPEKTGLEGATDRFTLVTTDGRELTLRLGKETATKDVYARADGWDEVVTIFPYSARALRKKPQEMRDLRFASLEPGDVVALEISSGERSLRLERSPEKPDWRVADSSEEKPAGFELDPNRVLQRLLALRSSRALALAPSDAETGLEKPAARIVATSKDGTEATIVFGAETEHEGRPAVFARGNADDATYLVAKFTRDTLLGGLSTFARPSGSPGGPGGLGSLPPEVRRKLEAQLPRRKAAAP